MSSIQINFVYDKGSKMAAIVAALEVFLRSCKDSLPAFAKPRHLDIREPLVHADINIHFSVPLFVGISWAHTNVLIKDDANWSEEWNPYLSSFDGVLPIAALEDKAALVAGLKEVFAKVLDRRPKHGVHHCPPILHIEDCPAISIVTPTYNRRKMIEIAFHNLIATDYPKNKIEWVVVEDNEDSTAMSSELVMNFQVNNPEIQVKYIPIQGRMSIGMKRNLGIENAKNDIILFMDDDDHYPVTSFRRRVAWLTKGSRFGNVKIAACTTIALYDLVRGVSAVNVPPLGLGFGKRISEATLTFLRSAWLERPFEDVSISEGENWLKGREEQCIELPPQQIIVAFSHSQNKSSRRIPPSDLKEVSCFWGFPKEYLVFVHQLAGMEIEEVKDPKGKKSSK
jgi:hypothetical protein